MTDWIFHLDSLCLGTPGTKTSQSPITTAPKGLGNAGRNHRVCSRHLGMKTLLMWANRHLRYIKARSPLFHSFLASKRMGLFAAHCRTHTQVFLFFIVSCTLWLLMSGTHSCGHRRGVLKIGRRLPSSSSGTGSWETPPRSSDPKQVLSHRQGWVIPGLGQCAAWFLKESWVWLQSDPCFTGWMCLVSSSHASKYCFFEWGTSAVCPVWKFCFV